MTSKSYKELLRRMHVIQDGKVINGAESFLIIWKNIPKYNFLYKIFKIKPLFFFLNIFYEVAAYFLFLKNKHLLKKWKRASCQRRFAPYVIDLLIGAKNGDSIGKKLNIVLRNALNLVQFKSRQYYWYIWLKIKITFIREFPTKFIFFSGNKI